MAQPEDSGTLTILSSLSFTLTLLLVLSTPFVEMSGQVSSAQSVYRIYAYGFAGLLQVVLVVLRGWQRSLRIYVTAVAPLLIWAGLSLLWTQRIDLTSKRLALLVAVYAGIFGGICDLSHQRSLLILRVVLVAVLILNFAAVFVVPEVGMDGGSMWRGFMAHKNIAGMLCAFTVIAFAFDGGKVPIAARLGVIAGALVFLALSWSKTALVALPIGLAAGGALALIRDRFPSSTEILSKTFPTGSRMLLAILVVALIVLTLQRDFLLSLTNDTSILTTRGAIWRPMIQFYLDSPLLGSGYGAYWDSSNRLIGPDTNRELWMNVDQGHNGYLDLLVQVGLPGLALALYAAITWPLAQLATLISRQPERAALIFAVLVFSLVENFSESSLFADDSLGNGILLIALAQLHRSSSKLSCKQNAEKSGGAVSAAQLRAKRQGKHRIDSDA